MKIKQISADATGFIQAAPCEDLETPAGAPDVKILVIGDMPYNEFAAKPFSGSHYTTLRNLFTRAGENFTDTYRCNVISQFPPKGSYADLDWFAARARIYEIIDAVQPDGILLLSDVANRLLFGNLNVPFAKDKSTSLESERGYPRPFKLGNKSYLTIATYHPKRIFQQMKYTDIVRLDISKLYRLARNGWKQKEYQITYWPSYEEAIQKLEIIEKTCDVLSVDTETRYPFITCIGFAWSETEAFVLPFHSSRLQPLWTPREEISLWRRLYKILTTKKLIGQNAMHFDSRVFYNYGLIANFVGDSMFLSWSLYQELPKSLGFLVSVYTDLPYHKDMLSDARRGRIDYKQEFYYCGLDCCTTLEVFNRMAEEAKKRDKDITQSYRFNLIKSKAFEYISRHGMVFDTAKRDARVKELSLQAAEDNAFIQKSLGFDLNVNSHAQVKELFYKIWKLPEKTRMVKDKDSGTEEARLTSDYLTTLYLARQFPGRPLLENIGNLRKLYHRISALRNIGVSKEGITYFSLSAVGTETGRASARIPIDGLGCQSQNVDRRDRDLWLAGDGMGLIKADLEGADNWTTGAQLASLGDHRLLNDLRAGLKPAQALAIAVIKEDTTLLKLPASELIPFLPLLKSEHGKKIYRVSKAIAHGSSYMMKKLTMHANIFKQSDGELYIEPDECERLQKLFYLRYDFPLLHKAMRSIMQSSSMLTTGFGITRLFLDRTDDAKLRKMLAFAPQQHTSGVADRVICNILRHPGNNDGFGKRILRPVNQVHDETDLLFPLAHKDAAFKVLSESWRVPIKFWNTDFVIPFGADWGPNWGECEEPIELK